MARIYLGIAQILKPNAEDRPELYAAVPLYSDNQALVERWLKDNIKALMEEGD